MWSLIKSGNHINVKNFKLAEQRGKRHKIDFKE